MERVVPRRQMSCPLAVWVPRIGLDRPFRAPRIFGTDAPGRGPGLSWVGALPLTRSHRDGASVGGTGDAMQTDVLSPGRPQGGARLCRAVRDSAKGRVGSPHVSGSSVRVEPPFQGPGDFWRRCPGAWPRAVVGRSVAPHGSRRVGQPLVPTR